MTAQQIADIHEAIMQRLAKERAACPDPDQYYENEADAILEVLVEVLK